MGKAGDRSSRSGTAANASKTDKSSAATPTAMPSGGARNINNANGNMAGGNGRGSNANNANANANADSNGRFDGPRSPPNTSHVPCKFFRQGACQAGNACPFSHDIGAAAENVCKYFAKGNCKFGPKCANIHVLPDGRRVNYGKHGLSLGGPALAMGRQHHNPTAYTPSTNASALTYSLRSEHSNNGGNNNNNNNNNDYMYDDRSTGQPGGTSTAHATPVPEHSIPAIDVPFSTDTYGSPRDDSMTARMSLGLSPVGKGFSALDAPLPASFDSTGFSNVAMYPAAPWPASVPSKFGMESPLPSLQSGDPRNSDALKMLHTSAFGGDNYLSTSSALPPGSPSMSSLLAVGEEQFGRRVMHSSRYAKPKLLSSSVPKGPAAVDRDWDAEFAFLEEDYVPQNLQELLTPAEKARRGSLRAVDAEEPIGLSSSFKYGSPILSGSPSRWGPTFARQEEEPRVNKVSAFGVVGSPLRTSSLATEVLRNSTLSAGLGSSSLTGSKPMSGSFGGSYGGGGDGFSMLSHQLQQTRLNDDTSRLSGSPIGTGYGSMGMSMSMSMGMGMGMGSLSGLSSSMSGLSGGLSGLSGLSGLKERHHSIPVSAAPPSSRLTTTIDEEDPSMLFDMEEHDSGDFQAPVAATSTAPAAVPVTETAKKQQTSAAAATVPAKAMPTTGWSYSDVLKAKASPAMAAAKPAS